MVAEQQRTEFWERVSGAATNLGKMAMTGVAVLEYGAGFTLAMGGVAFIVLGGIAGQLSESVAEIGGVATIGGLVLMAHAESWM